MEEAQTRGYEDEMRDLKREIESFKKEKERVRAIVGRAGGVPSVHSRMINWIFMIFLFGCVGASLAHAWHVHDIQGIFLELAVAAVSIKLIYLMNNQARVNHFQLWILSSLEWRLNETAKEIQTLRRAANTERS